MGGGGKYFAAGEKIKSCSEYTPLKEGQGPKPVYLTYQRHRLDKKKMYNSLFRPGLGLEELYKEVQDNMTNGSILIIDNLSFLSLLGFSDRQVFLKPIFSNIKTSLSVTDSFDD